MKSLVSYLSDDDDDDQHDTSVGGGQNAVLPAASASNPLDAAPALSAAAAPQQLSPIARGKQREIDVAPPPHVATGASSAVPTPDSASVIGETAASPTEGAVTSSAAAAAHGESPVAGAKRSLGCTQDRVENDEGPTIAPRPVASAMRLEVKPITETSPPFSASASSPSPSKKHKPRLSPPDFSIHPLLPLLPPARAATKDRTWSFPTLSTDSPCSSSLEAKLAHFHHLKQQGTHFNASLSSNRSFNNPHIYDKLVKLVRVTETETNFRDRCRWKTSMLRRHEMEEANKDCLALKQRKAADLKAEQKKKEQRNRIDFASAGVGGSSSSRRSGDDRALQKVSRWKDNVASEGSKRYNRN